MNLAKLFELQRQLDEHIEREHPRQEGEDRLAKKILALYSELGELLNEWRGFKFWSNDQEPRTYKKHICPICHGEGYFSITEEWRYSKCEECDGEGYTHESNPLLEEYVDCLHFILSIGLELGITEIHNLSSDKGADLLFMFMEVNESSIILIQYAIDGNDAYSSIAYIDMFEKFLGLGEMLGFTWEQIEEAYLRKNAVNHERQNNNY
ncbi:dimeric dUTPase (all-alpha-NTP-PPase superfamily) [Anoxybacillus tepidamans]|uniref:Dimeric dUTPase (All-alpha-NTP-PPase superfamily) n=1 Tax=Anoxybacteroides tepidamans TaxID=265948 RepID=A0A7W8IQB2_9BACL|nr:dUTP diphosphatase [Anoxybacillus tepidamans]MBB5324663.1 dimeric dUTPase (all-alpha-NTP-PPase superfamily) [Anoxybacillus tepidamans]